MTNTMIRYHYRDGDNYKGVAVRIFTGPFDAAQEAALRALCMKEDGHDFFVPAAVDMPIVELAGGWDAQSDHAFHTIEEISATEANADDKRTIDELIEIFGDMDWEDEGARIAAEHEEEDA